MPARTNQFQQLLYVVQRILEPGAVVVHSEELVDAVTGDRREVDVCVHAQVSGHEVTVSIECRDHKRRQGIEWVEQMQAKHANLKTNVLVLASSSGFTTSAVRKAAVYGIQLVEPQALNPSFEAVLKEKIAPLRVESLRLVAQGMTVILAADGLGPEESLDLIPGQPLFDSDGEPMGESASDLARYILDRLPAELRRTVTAGSGELAFSANVGSTGKPVLVWSSASGRLRQIVHLELRVRANADSAELWLQPSEISGLVVASGSAALGGVKITAVAEIDTQAVGFKPESG